ncbi:chloride intracellular channel Clic-like [Periplaneta americana]|uniref:chloride intracellular channel Clic-like n=1 Tax=Periplaneta americana TaxID=6978 RepID=UPI0037E87802
MTEEKKITLYVKAGRSPDTLGACSESQRAHLLARLKLKHVNPVLVDVENPPLEFTSAGFARVPAVLHSDGTGSDENVVEVLLEKYPGGVLNSGQEELEDVENVTRDVYLQFCKYMYEDDYSGLQEALQSLDEFLSKRDFRFLFGDEMSLLDCQVLPQLHKVRVVVDRIKGCSIPGKLHRLWMYLFHAYMDEAFTQSCPPDLEYLLNWTEKLKLPSSAIKMPEWLPESCHATYLSFDVPGICVCPAAPH